MKIKPYSLFEWLTVIGVIYLWVSNGRESDTHLTIAIIATGAAAFVAIMVRVFEDVDGRQ